MSGAKPRYERQMRLAEVGEAGQQRIIASRLQVAPSTEGEVEVMYLERAGVTRVDERDAPAQPFKHQMVFRHAAPKAFGAGAWRALRQLTGVLGV